MLSLNNQLSIADHVALQAEQSPGKSACIFQSTRISYGELVGKASCLAAILKSKGVEANSFVPLLFDKSIDLIIATLALQMLNAAYVPVDLNNPRDRILRMLDRVGAKVILTGKEYRDIVPAALGEVFTFCSEELTEAQYVPSQGHIGSTPIYAIFTSGTTGEPKAAINLSQGIKNRLLYMNEKFEWKSDDSVLFTANHSFDASYWQMFWPLMNGGTVVIPRQGKQFSLLKRIKLIEKHRISVIGLAPAMIGVLNQLLGEYPELRDNLSSVRLIFTGGESVNHLEVIQLKRNCRGARIVHTYGPSEASIGVLMYFIDDENVSDPIPIGTPIANVEVVLMADGIAVDAPGQRGEIYLGGLCVGGGYLNNPDETKKRFVHLDRNGRRSLFYRTGDYAFYSEAGNLVFAGRSDEQVSINGIRVELGEVRSALLGVENVKDAVVCYSTEKKEISAFYITGAGIDDSQLRAHLEGLLPDFMVPRKLLSVDAFPLTENGKIDKKQLVQLLE